MVKGAHDRGAASLENDLLAMGIVLPKHLIVVEEVDAGTRQGTVQQLEPVALERRPLVAGEEAGILDRHLVRLEVYALPFVIAAVLVPTCQYLAVAHQRALGSIVHVHEGPDARASGGEVGRCHLVPPFQIPERASGVDRFVSPTFIAVMAA